MTLKAAGTVIYWVKETRGGPSLVMKMMSPDLDMLSLRCQWNIQVESLCRQLDIWFWSSRFENPRYINGTNVMRVNAFIYLRKKPKWEEMFALEQNEKHI